MDLNKDDISEATTICRSDPNFKSDILQQIGYLKEANRKMQIEFDMQRAKLKDLYIQKETEFIKCQGDFHATKCELDDLKSQLIVANMISKNELQLKESKAQDDEVTSLHRLIQETIEETSLCKAELQRLREENCKLWIENRELREHQDNTAPQVLSQVKKTLVKRLGSEFGSSASIVRENDYSNSILNRSVDQFANEDAELLRSLVIQLQEENNALKEKIRNADEELNATNLEPSKNKNSLGNNHSKLTQTDSVCDSCLPNMQINNPVKKNSEENEVESLKKMLDDAQADLLKEGHLRKALENEWQEKREAHKLELQQLQKQVKLNEQQLFNLQQALLETKEELLHELQRVCKDREETNRYLLTLQADNDFLSGRYLATSEEIENQYINLPNTLPELHEIVLKQQTEIIQARVAAEYEKQKSLTSLDELQILYDQLTATNEDLKKNDETLKTKIKLLQNELSSQILRAQEYEKKNSALEHKDVELERQLSSYRVEIIETQKENEKLKKMYLDCRSKVKNLQDDLVTSEQVQKDFVKLSQTLQMSLEKLRRADTEVRWQNDDDIDCCPSCNVYFTVTIRKIHCRHCGHIFCDKCLTKVVPSGPRKRKARVCDICHTLLTPNTAPYFSHEQL